MIGICRRINKNFPNMLVSIVGMIVSWSIRLFSTYSHGTKKRKNMNRVSTQTILNIQAMNGVNDAKKNGRDCRKGYANLASKILEEMV